MSIKLHDRVRVGEMCGHAEDGAAESVVAGVPLPGEREEGCDSVLRRSQGYSAVVARHRCVWLGCLK